MTPIAASFDGVWIMYDKLVCGIICCRLDFGHMTNMSIYVCGSILDLYLKQNFHYAQVMWMFQFLHMNDGLVHSLVNY